jgi:hypothetical protein
MAKGPGTSGKAPVDLSKSVAGKISAGKIRTNSGAVTDLPSSPPIDLQTREVGSFNAQEASHQLRKEWADRILKIFRSANIAIGALVFVLVAIDVTLLVNKIIEPSDRWITEKVILGIIGATIVQLGAAAFAITRSLFGSNEA